jgi:hypothetical protein
MVACLFDRISGFKAVDLDLKLVYAFLSYCFRLTLATYDLAELLDLVVISPVFGHNFFNFNSLFHDEVGLYDESFSCAVLLEVELAVDILCLEIQILLLAVHGVSYVYVLFVFNSALKYFLMAINCLLKSYMIHRSIQILVPVKEVMRVLRIRRNVPLFQNTPISCDLSRSISSLDKALNISVLLRGIL